MQSPKEFEKSPLVDAVIEIRFKSPDNADIIPGLVYSQLRQEFPVINELPTLQLPLYIRENDPNVKFQPTHTLQSEDFILNVGPSVFGLGCRIEQGKKKYPGWEKFIEKFINVLEKVESLEFITGAERLGVRYTNFFQRHDLFADLSLKLETGWEGEGLQPERLLSFVISQNQYTSRVTINTAVATGDVQNPTKGQVIDIDTFLEKSMKLSEVKEHAIAAHESTENVFFNLLNEETKVELGAKYD